MSNLKPVDLHYKLHKPVGGFDERLSPIIFIHGLSDSKDIWGDIPQIIADKSRRMTYSVDSRNHGDSERSDVFNFDINVDDLLHFMDSRSVKKAVLIGHSMGGITSIRASLKCNDRVEMILVEDMYVRRIPQEMLDAVLEYCRVCEEAAEHIPSNYNEVDAQKFIVNYLFEKESADVSTMGSPESLQNIFLALKKTENGRYALKANMKVILKALENGDTIMTEPEGVFEGPVYFLYGAISPFRVNEHEEHIRQFFPNAEFIPFQGADHNVHPQFPNEFVEVVLKCILKH